MKNRITLSISAVALIVAGAIYAFAKENPFAAIGGQAQQHREHRWPGGDHELSHMAKDLNLTDAQQSQIKAIFDEDRAATEPLMQKLDESRRQLQTATANGQFDEEKVRAIATQQAQTMIELMVARERVKAKIYNVLTPEQRAKADARHEHMPPMGPLPPPPPDRPFDR